MRHGLGACVLVVALAGRSPSSEPPDRKEAPATLTEPDRAAPVAKEDCDGIIEEVDTRLASGEIALEERNPLYARVREMAGGSACAETIARRLRSHRCETASAGVITAALLASTGATSDHALAIVQRAHSELRRGSRLCMMHAIGAVQGSRSAGLPVAEALLQLATGGPDAQSREAGWLAFGSVGRSAVLRGDSDVVAFVDTNLGARLATGRTGDLGPLLEAAGNAGCSACAPFVARAAVAPSAEVRRVAVGAMRFDPASGAVSAMCGALGADSEESVREHAAWALGHLDTHTGARRACLERAARGDESPPVRAAAIHALEALGSSMPIDRSDPARSL